MVVDVVELKEKQQWRVNKMFNGELTSKEILEMKVSEISDLLQECYEDNVKKGVEEAYVQLYATFPDTEKRMVLTISLCEAEDEK